MELKRKKSMQRIPRDAFGMFTTDRCTIAYDQMSNLEFITVDTDTVGC